MKSILAITFALVLGGSLAGCGKSEAEAAPAAKIDPTKDGPPGVSPMTTAPIPGAPVSGAETVTGAGGGGVGQAMKDRARDTAAGSPSSINQPAPEDDFDDSGDQ
jgi:hypothetical protein